MYRKQPFSYHIQQIQTKQLLSPKYTLLPSVSLTHTPTVSITFVLFHSERSGNLPFTEIIGRDLDE